MFNGVVSATKYFMEGSLLTPTVNRFEADFVLASDNAVGQCFETELRERLMKTWLFYMFL
jgi:hypothetical protein